MAEPILTIVVPTFNRPEKAKRLIAQCLEQRTDRVAILVLDNASDRVIADELADIAQEMHTPQFRVVRHPVNIGIYANILRCFEAPQTPWVWIIGDDDELESGAMERVLQAIEQNPDALDINFGGSMFRHISGRERAGSARYESLDALIDGMDCFGNYVFISTNVYNRARLLPYLQQAYSNAPTFLPQLAMVMAALKDRAGVVCVLPSGIVHWGKPEEEEDRWDGVVIYREEYNVLYLADDEPTRLRMAKLLEGNEYPWLGFRDYFLRLAFDKGADRSMLRDELLRSMGMRTLSTGGRKGFFTGGLALAFEPVLIVLTYVFKLMKHGFRRPRLAFVTRPSRSIAHPRL